MKLLHTADIHLGITPNGETMEEDQRFFIHFLADAAKAENADAVIIAGDIFDRALPSVDAVRLYDEMMTLLCKECPVFAIAGNHDGADRISSTGALLEKAGLYIRGRLTLPIEPVTLKKDGDETDIYLMPYFSIEEAAYALGDSTIRSMAEAYKAVIDTVSPREEAFSVLVSHCFAGGAEVSGSDRSAVLGGTGQVPSALFDKFGYAALGHLHRRQKAGAKGMYAGSPLQYGFGETEKYILTIDTKTGVTGEINVPLPRRFRTVEGSYDELLKNAAVDENSGDIMRVIVTDRRLPVGATDAFRRFYPNMAAISDRAERANTSGGISAEEIEKMNAGDILDLFMKSETGRCATDEEKKWFADAMREADDR